MTGNENFQDRIAKLCLSHFDRLPKSGKPNDKEWTILSCIVQESRANFEVVALGTGSKCIGHDKMSLHGDILNDSHAEIICRRAFIRYLYEMTNNSSDMKFNTETGRFEINRLIKFHFFTTHVPCGDSAIFPKQNPEDFGASLFSANNEAQEPLAKKLKTDENDIFRTGAKCLDGTPDQDQHLSGSNYHIVGVVRTKPGRGVRTLSVSCSDKIAKWCHLGVQGALLSVLLSEPVYLSSFTVGGGTPFDKGALERAFFGRFGQVSLKPPYQQNHLLIKQSNLEFKFRKIVDKVPCPSSICHWIKRSRNSAKITEVAVEGRKQGVTRKQLLKDSGHLKLCKKELFKCFSRIIADFEIKVVSKDIKNLSYRETKKLARDYQEAWSNLKVDYFKVWPQKNECLLDFK